MIGNNVAQLIVMDEMLLYFLLIMPSTFILIIFMMILLKAPKQVRTMIKAWLRKRMTHIVITASGTLDLLAGKMDKTGDIEIGKAEYYLPAKKTGNPGLGTVYFWKNTGIPVSVGDGRKAVHLSPDVLVAGSVAEVKVEDRKDEIPEAVRDYLKDKGFDLTAKPEKKGKKRKIVDAVKNVFMPLNMSVLKELLTNVMDVDAVHIIWDKAFNRGFKAAGKQYFAKGFAVMLVLIGFGILIFSIGLVTGMI